MPVTIGSFEPLAEEEFTALRQQKARKTDPAMVALLAEVAAGRPVRVPLVEDQSARGLRTAISRAAGSRGLSVETVAGEGFVAVRKSDDMSHFSGDSEVSNGVPHLGHDPIILRFTSDDARASTHSLSVERVQ